MNAFNSSGRLGRHGVGNKGDKPAYGPPSPLPHAGCDERFFSKKTQVVVAGMGTRVSGTISGFVPGARVPMAAPTNQ